MENEKKEQLALDDTQRVRVLSPGMMVAKRFFRNKLAIVGIVIIIAMFLFAFAGGALNPYTQSQVFYTTEIMKKDFAGVTEISDYQLVAKEGVTLPGDIVSKMLIATKDGRSVQEMRDGSLVAFGKLSDAVYLLLDAQKTDNPALLLSDEYKEAKKADRNWFVSGGQTYVVDGEGLKADLYVCSELGIASMTSMTPYVESTVFSYEFYKNALTAISMEETQFESEGSNYNLEMDSDYTAMVRTEDGTDYAYISRMNINSFISGIYLTPDFKEHVIETIESGKKEMEYEVVEGEPETFLIAQKSPGQYTIQRYQETRVIDTYAAPSSEHLVGTDANGMDLLARLMYGGRISLLIGFVVVVIELILGVIIGGTAGFFGGWVDTLLMRIVDIVYCIPAMPLYLILGSIMDYYKAAPKTRIYMLCIIMSIIGWVGIARIVRGQILSLREQEFMTAAEATGIRVSRRIFRHLVPNVIPQMVVFASMEIGGVILAEASLSFLGLGIKYPAATWGSILNAVNDSYVMTNYLFVWIPAGLLILLTVLAFNFIGDGLRDAFDPKMKR